jgi:hypothetical protein
MVCPILLQSKMPGRFQSMLNHITKALPTKFDSGTNPQQRLSLLLSRLSPIMK